MSGRAGDGCQWLEHSFLKCMSRATPSTLRSQAPSPRVTEGDRVHIKVKRPTSVACLVPTTKTQGLLVTSTRTNTGTAVLLLHIQQ
jgi:hypothetical protein